MLQGLHIQRQLPVQVIYKGVTIKDPLYLDLLVNNKVIVEVKAIEKTLPIYETQLLTYLRLTGMKLGLLVNFGEAQVKHGITRVVNGL